MTSLRFALCAALVAPLLAPARVTAHPMGNFTVSHYAGFTISAEGLRLRYVLDYAEIPAFQEQQAIDTSGDGRVTSAEEAAYLAKKIPSLLRGLSLELDGKPVPLAAQGRRLAWAPGAGGLRTLKLEVEAAVPAARLRPGNAGKGGWHTARYHDGNLPVRTGWKEIVVTSREGGTVAGSTAPAVDRSRALCAYPKDLLTNPPQDLAAEFHFSIARRTAARMADRPTAIRAAVPVSYTHLTLPTICSV